jgi:hypothetical protein
MKVHGLVAEGGVLVGVGVGVGVRIAAGVAVGVAVRVGVGVVVIVGVLVGVGIEFLHFPALPALKTEAISELLSARL